MIVTKTKSISLVEDKTQELLEWAAEIEHSHATYLDKGQALARKLGAHYRSDGLTEIGFWTPELTGDVMRPRDIYLEVFTPKEAVKWDAKEQKISFHRDRLRLKQQGELFWGVFSGMIPGNREQLGSLYWLRYLDQLGHLQISRDVLAHSLPYGVFAPAELYDIDRLQSEREDLDYFTLTGTTKKTENIPRVKAPRNILQIHVGTASEEGTLEGLTRIYRSIAEKIKANQPLTKAEENYYGYDALQLLPLEPTIEYRDHYSPESNFFHVEHEEESYDEILASLPLEDEIEITLIKPNTQDWGYDVPIMGSSATNAALLASQRPDEVVDFIATLHNFPSGPIQIIYDLVYGHADNQSQLLLSRLFLKGPNMYGQDLNHQLPYVRAFLLEMQRRKINTGADGVRIDGGQDFRFFNPLSGRVEQDDAYLLSMSDVVQEIGHSKRLLFTIFEDGRPWPEEGWEEISTYRDLIEIKPESYQWGPLIFAHNTPTLEHFWEKKWRRVSEVMYQGENWITGCGNHDTVRRGNQIDPNQPINWNLGKNLQEVLHNAYDNHAVNLWVYGFSPGLPMDFINGTMRAPWMFFRNTDDRYGVKVVSEEMGFLDWQITPEIYQSPEAFTRVKSLGFERLEQLKEFGKALQESLVSTDYNLNHFIDVCHSCLGDNTDACEITSLRKLNRPGMIAFLKELDIPTLNQFALMFMEDCYEICNVAHYIAKLDPVQTKFNYNLRLFRHNHPWVHQNLLPTDRFNKISDEEGTIFYGIRHNPEDTHEAIAMVAHMGGEPKDITLGDWLQLDLNEWEVAIASPGLNQGDNLADLRCFPLADSQGLLLKTKPKTE